VVGTHFVQFAALCIQARSTDLNPKGTVSLCLGCDVYCSQVSENKVGDFHCTESCHEILSINFVKFFLYLKFIQVGFKNVENLSMPISKVWLPLSRFLPKLARQHFVNNDGVRFHENICLCLLSERTQLSEDYAFVI